MNKPLDASLIYRSKQTQTESTGAQETGHSVVTFEQTQEMNAISSKILELIVAKHS
jgi:hypothetical protein